MFCQNCNDKIANSYCRFEVDGEIVEKYLCQSCKELLTKNKQSVQQNFDVDKSLFCKNCGTTLNDFLSSSFLGCECCYLEFESFLENSFKQNQKNAVHCGKVPFLFEKKQNIEHIEGLLEMAIENKDLNQINRLNFMLKQAKEAKNET